MDEDREIQRPNGKMLKYSVFIQTFILPAMGHLCFKSLEEMQAFTEGKHFRMSAAQRM